MCDSISIFLLIGLISVVIAFCYYLFIKNETLKKLEQAWIMEDEEFIDEYTQF